MFSSLGEHLGDRDIDIKNEQKYLDLLIFVLELRERHFEQHIPTRSESQMLNTMCENDWRYYFYF